MFILDNLFFVVDDGLLLQELLKRARLLFKW
jgi:hypothetical protein